MSTFGGDPSPASTFGEDSARALRTARRLWTAGTWAMILWVAVTGVVNTALKAPPIVWEVTSALTFLVFIPGFIVAVVVSERLRGKASRLAGERLGYRVNGKVTGVPKWLMKRGPAATLAFIERVNKGEAESAARPRIADLRAAVPRNVWIISVTGAFVLTVGVLLSIVAIVIGIVSIVTPVALSPVVLLVSALVCYAIGFPMMLAFARNFRRKKAPTSDR